ncbi:hypothetical protein AK830_g6432 [Neonectria ditissima]|uniref:Zn(2)-C6 fungal-type domain-containing protein n=1 Tax=Neonectria ditissima TaxID=78410 RepID=A0A0P7BCE8_9HYPO|nr:hypothetical protein AK830_g6432 [Neonectria ditissima]
MAGTTESRVRLVEHRRSTHFIQTSPPNTAPVISGNCRTRRIKCDEKKPCGHCTRKGLECKQTDFIVQDKWSKSAAAHTTPRNESTSEAVGLSTGCNLESTYEVFQQVHTNSQRESRCSPQPALSQVKVTEESAHLLRIYQNGIATWMDILDHSLSYQRHVVRHALSSSLLLHAICALSAKQMSLVGEAFLWQPVSSRYYGESLGLLIKEVTERETSREVILSATILLCSYELLALPGPDYQRHMYGACTLIKTYDISANSSRLEQASFWIFARQDVALAVANECPTLIPPGEWPLVPGIEEAEEDHLGNRMLWFLARILEFKFSPTMDGCSRTKAQGLWSLSAEIDLWWKNLPLSVRGVVTTDAKDDGLAKMWFCVPSAAARRLYYHMAKIIIFEGLLERSTDPSLGTSEDTLSANDLHLQAQAIALICLSQGLPEAVLPVAVNPLFYAARHIQSLSLKTKLWAVLDQIENRLGFHTQNRVALLQKELVHYA